MLPRAFDDDCRAIAVPIDRPALLGTGIARLLLKYAPVSDLVDDFTFAGRPDAVISPPLSPDPGPKSTR